MKQNTVLSPISKQEICHNTLNIDTFLIKNNIISLLGHRACSSTMLFVVSYGIYPIFIQNMTLNLTFWNF